MPAAVYVKDLAPGDLVLASTSATGVKGNGTSSGPMLSGDGTMVVFTSGATNLDPADTDSDTDVYVRNLLTGDLILASTSDTGEKSNDFSAATSIAADGTGVSFFSNATNLDPVDTDALADIYVKNLDSGDLMLALTSSTGEKGDADSYFDSRLSADGYSLVFDAYATNLHPEASGVLQVYLKDLITGNLTLASRTTDGEVANSYTFHAQLSADEASVAFASWARNLDPSDTDARTDIYVKDLETGELTLVSTNASGIKGDDDSDYPMLAADGRSVVFESIADNLDPSDTDTLTDIYVKDLNPGVPTCLGSPVTLLGTSRADEISGTAADDVIATLGGADVVDGRGGDDLICAGSGADVVSAGAGDDSVSGGGGPDRLVGGSGDDTLRGGPGPDVLRAGAGYDTCFGGSGTDAGTGCEAKSGIP
jgi:Tol biopolymer transport system component